MPDFDLNEALAEAPYAGPVFKIRRTLDPEVWLRLIEKATGEYNPGMLGCSHLVTVCEQTDNAVVHLADGKFYTLCQADDHFAHSLEEAIDWLRSQPANKVERPQFITWND